MTNEYIILGDYAVIFCNRSHVKVSLEDFALVSGITGTWTISTNGYCLNCLPDRTVRYIHRMIMGLEYLDELCVDHINGLRNDCRRDNLEVVTYQVNNQRATQRRMLVGEDIVRLCLQ